MRLLQLVARSLALGAMLFVVQSALASANDKSIDEMTAEELYAEAEVITTKLARIAEIAKGDPDPGQVDYAAKLLARLSAIQQRLEKLEDQLSEKEFGFILYLYEGVDPGEWSDPKMRGAPTRFLSSGVYSPALGSGRTVWEGKFFKGSYVDNQNPVGEAKLIIRLEKKHNVISIDREDTEVNREGAGWAYNKTFYYYEFKLDQGVTQGTQRVFPGMVWEKQGEDRSKLKFINHVQAVFYRG